MEQISVNLQSFSYGGQEILKDVSFSAGKGECLVITGLSGCGKTTLFRLMNGLIPELYEGEVRGEIRLLGRELSSYSKGETAKYVGNVFQNPNDQFFSTVVEDEIALVGENMGMEREELRRRVRNAMDQMNISSLKNHSVHELSGGQKQKVAIASTLVYDTEILLLDEPSASLDYTATEDLKETLKTLKQMGKTILISEHRLYYLKGILDRLLVLEDGTLKHIYAAEELTEEVRCRHHLRSFDEECLSAEEEPCRNEPSVRVESLLVQNGKYRLARHVDFMLRDGECMGLIGTNGIGKTTLAKELIGLLPVKEGCTDYGDNMRSRMANTSIALQHCSNMLFRESVEHELIPNARAKDVEYLKQVKESLLALELWEKKDARPQELSGGEKQRLALLLAMLKESRLLIFDEPTSGLDRRRMELVARIIKNRERNTPILLITHDLELLFKVCHSVYLLSSDGGKKLDVVGNESVIRDFLKGAPKT